MLLVVRVFENYGEGAALAYEADADLIWRWCNSVLLEWFCMRKHWVLLYRSMVNNPETSEKNKMNTLIEIS